MSREALKLVDGIREINSPPDGFPKEQVQEIANVLVELPHGTAEGCRVPLEYARLRLASIRREYMTKSDSEELMPFSRGGSVDSKFASLYTAIGTALDQYRALAAEAMLDDEPPEPTVATPTNRALLDRGLSAGAKLQAELTLDKKLVSQIAEPNSIRAENVQRQMNDAVSLVRLSRNEIGMPGLIMSWYQGAITKLEGYPTILLKTVDAIEKGVDISERLWGIWDKFKSESVHHLFALFKQYISAIRDIIHEIEAARPEKFAKSKGPSENIEVDLALVHSSILSGVPVLDQWRHRVTQLNFNGSSISNLHQISEIESLQSLSLDSTGVTDLSGLSGMPSLRSLSLNSTRADISRLNDLNALEEISLRYSQPNLHSIGNLVKLRRLDLGYSIISDLSLIKTNLALEYLNLEHTNVNDAGSLSGLIKLTDLNLDHTSVANVKPLASLQRLRRLVLSNTKVSDISPLMQLKCLEVLLVGHSGISEISNCKNLELLQVLAINNTDIENLNGISGLASLETLVCNDTRIADLTPLSVLPELRRIDLRNTPVRSLECLNGLKKIDRIFFTGDQAKYLLPTLDKNIRNRIGYGPSHGYIIDGA